MEKCIPCLACTNRFGAPDHANIVPQESSFENCPICGTSVARGLLHQHVNACLDSDPPSVSRPPPQPDEGPDDTVRGQADDLGGQRCHKHLEAVANADVAKVCQCSGGTDCTDANSGRPQQLVRPNAFAQLMDNQRKCSSVHNYYLEQCSDGGWDWHWWCSTGSSPSSASKRSAQAAEDLTQPVAASPPASSPDDSTQQPCSRAAPAKVDMVWTSTSQLPGVD